MWSRGAALALLLLAELHAGAASAGFVAVPVNAVPRARDRSRKRAAAHEGRLDNMDFFYAAEVNIGTPPQPVTVLVDTGSSELWVNPDCSTAPSPVQARQCAKMGRYDPRKSQTPPQGPFGREVIRYGDPSDSSTQTAVSIRYYRDAVALGSARIANQTFGVVERSTGQGQGILGLAPSVRSTDGGHGGGPGYSLVLNSMAEQGLIASRVFALDLRRAGAKTGAVVYGGLDRSKFVGALEKRPMVRGLQKERRLAVEMTSIGLTLPGSAPRRADVVAGSDDANVMLDSGTTISRLHASLAQPILDALNASESSSGFFSVPCALTKANGTVDFGFGAKTVRVALSDFIIGDPDVDTCLAGVVLTTDQQILGDSVLRAGYFVFDWDNNAVHIAQAADCGPNDIVAVGSGSGAVPQVTGHCRDEDAQAKPTQAAQSNPTASPGRSGDKDSAGARAGPGRLAVAIGAAAAAAAAYHCLL